MQNDSWHCVGDGVLGVPKMQNNMVIVIAGPTATGKTAFGIELAQIISGEIVSADAMQIYKYMDIGTAKPTIEERNQIPHHMLDIISPFDNYSVSRYVTEASQCIDNILSRNKTPIIVGGTGLYIDSLLSNRNFTKRASESIRNEIEHEYDKLGGDEMLRILGEFDLQRAKRLHPNDKKRIVRAIEVYRVSGTTISQHDTETKNSPPRYDAMKYALTVSDRIELYKRIDNRVDDMIEKGLADEVRRLLDMGISHNSTAMQAIGYKEMADAIIGLCDMDSAIDKIKMESRRYAKRQLTWFRRDPEIKWFEL